MQSPCDGADEEEGQLEEGELQATEDDLALWPQPDASGEKLLAAKPDGRAPYFASAGCDGWRGGTGKKKKKKKSKAQPGYVDIYGQGATASVELRHNEGPIKLADVQNLVMWVLADGVNPRWCFVKNKPLVQRVVLLAAHGIDRALWEQHSKEALPAWRRLLGQPIDLQARNALLAYGQTAHALLTVPARKKRRREDVAPAGTAATAGAGGAAGAEAVAAAAAPDLHDAAHGVAAEGTAAAAQQLQPGGSEASTDTPDAAVPNAKRVKLARSDDVSVHAEMGLPQPPPAPLPPAPPAPVVVGPGQQAADGSIRPNLGKKVAGPLPPSHYVLTLEQLQLHGYPLPQLDEATGELVCPEGFVATQSRRQQREQGQQSGRASGQPAPAPCGAAAAAAAAGGAAEAGSAEPVDGEEAQAEQPELVGVDCEMCITEEGFELTRATLIDAEGRVLLDELVVPHNPITDYNTQYSGITAAMLEGVSTRLEDIQARFCQIVSAETLLVAHSGENDLKALKICHANVLDTAVMFPHPRGGTFKSALRVLASRYLTRTIQQGSHNPIEDAKAAMDLALLKIARGPAFGISTGERSGERLIEVLGEHGRQSCLVDRLEMINRHLAGACSAIPVETDAQAVAKVAKECCKGAAAAAAAAGAAAAVACSNGTSAGDQLAAAEPAAEAAAPLSSSNGLQATAPAPGVHFIFSQLMALQECYQQRVTALAAAAEPVPCASYSSPAARARVQAALQEMDSDMEALWHGLPAGTLLIVVTGQGDTPYSRHVQEQRYRRQQRLDGLPPWSPACEADMAALQAQVQQALCFAAVKGGGSSAGGGRT